MKRSYAIALTLSLLVLFGGGFSLGYGFHMSRALVRFARETGRDPSDYDWKVVWTAPPGGGRERPHVLAHPNPRREASRDAWSRWRWPVAGADADLHQLIWRVREDRWELLEDLENDVSLDPFPEEGTAP